MTVQRLPVGRGKSSRPSKNCGHADAREGVYDDTFHTDLYTFCIDLYLLVFQRQLALGGAIPQDSY